MTEFPKIGLNKLIILVFILYILLCTYTQAETLVWYLPDCSACDHLCGVGKDLADGRHICSASCTNGVIQPENLSECDCQICPEEWSCTDGVCCPPGQTNCGCQNVVNDVNNCGKCGNICPIGGSCTNGVCVCPSGQSACGGYCQDIKYDDNNCGTCGHICPTGKICIDGSCERCDYCKKNSDDIVNDIIDNALKNAKGKTPAERAENAWESLKERRDRGDNSRELAAADHYMFVRKEVGNNHAWYPFYKYLLVPGYQLFKAIYYDLNLEEYLPRTDPQGKIIPSPPSDLMLKWGKEGADAGLKD